MPDVYKKIQDFCSQHQCAKAAKAKLTGSPSAGTATPASGSPSAVAATGSGTGQPPKKVSFIHFLFFYSFNILFQRRRTKQALSPETIEDSDKEEEDVQITNLNTQGTVPTIGASTVSFTVLLSVTLSL